MENSKQLAGAGVPRVGSLARVRQRLYLLEDVRPSVEPGDSPLVGSAAGRDKIRQERTSRRRRQMREDPADLAPANFGTLALT
ncbi:MAG TPA: hypothetical protein VIY49_12210 [Bryobacteraceae bacterium]